jgi:hypothetical protein
MGNDARGFLLQGTTTKLPARKIRYTMRGNTVFFSVPGKFPPGIFPKKRGRVCRAMAFFVWLFSYAYRIMRLIAIS